jgi:predicted component of type VI protein secretion system
MRLVIEDEAGTRSAVPFTGDEIVIGRGGEEVTFRLGDRDVSRRHARFVHASGAVFVEDLGSLTGTRVNGERIQARRRLREGDLVQIGDYDLAVMAEADAAAAGAPPPLPAAPRAAPAEPAPAPAPAAPPPQRSEPAPARGIAARLLLAGVVALALGAAAGWAFGTFVSPPAQAPLSRLAP